MKGGGHGNEGVEVRGITKTRARLYWGRRVRKDAELNSLCFLGMCIGSLELRDKALNNLHLEDPLRSELHELERWFHLPPLSLWPETVGQGLGP